MSVSTQSIFAGRLDAAYRQETARLGTAIPRIWSKQPGLWRSDAEHARVIANRLGWLDVLDLMRSATAELIRFAEDARQAGLRDIVLLGMGGSSLAAEVLSLTFPATADARRFFVLDSTDPESILAVERVIDLRHTLFIVASKSGKTIETLSQFFYFYRRVSSAGIHPPGRQFIAITDPGSFLEQLAADYSMRGTFLNPADIGGRYSALSYFGLVPAALRGVDLGRLLDGAAEMRAACGPDAPAQANPALALGALIGAAARNGADKLFLLATPQLIPLGNWIEQLVAESTGKEGKGAIPFTGGAAQPAEVLAEGGVVVTLSLAGEDTTALHTLVASLQRQGVPVAEIALKDAAELGGEFFKWEVATAVAGAVLGINPFDEPNVQESKDDTARILDQFQSSASMPVGSPRLSEAGIELYADGSVRHSISTLRLSEALRTFLSQQKQGDYLALLAYLDRNAANAQQLDALRAFLSGRLQLPVLLGYGPRYMHSIGQLHKGGPPTGMFLVITSAKKEDVAIPGAKYSFGQLQMAQALGDLESLGRRNKPALRLHLTKGAEAGLADLRKAVGQALATRRLACG